MNKNMQKDPNKMDDIELIDHMHSVSCDLSDTLMDLPNVDSKEYRAWMDDDIPNLIKELESLYNNLSRRVVECPIAGCEDW